MIGNVTIKCIFVPETNINLKPNNMKTVTKSICTDKRTFLISFEFTAISGEFIFQNPGQLLTILMDVDSRHGIKKIKEYNSAKSKFMHVKKAEFKRCMEALSQHAAPLLMEDKRFLNL